MLPQAAWITDEQGKIRSQIDFNGNRTWTATDLDRTQTARLKGLVATNLAQRI